MTQIEMPIPALRGSVRLNAPCTPAALAGLDAPLLGLADGDRPVLMPEDAGHVLVGTGSGGGTTTLLRTTAAQALARGAEVDVLDVGGSAHRWAAGLPRVTYLSRIGAVHQRLLLAAASLKDGTRSWDGGWPARRVLLLENVATLAYGLRQHWLHTRPETQLDEAPGVEALALLLAAGPEFGVQILAGNPRGDLPGIQPAPVSALFSTRVLACGGTVLWKRVAPEIWVPPVCSATAGRMHVVADRAVTAFQALQLSDREARALASGIHALKDPA